MNSKLYVGERRYLERHMPTGMGTLPTGAVEVLGFRKASRSPVTLTLVKREKDGRVYAVNAVRLIQQSHRMGVGEVA